MSTLHFLLGFMIGYFIIGPILTRLYESYKALRLQLDLISIHKEHEDKNGICYIYGDTWSVSKKMYTIDWKEVLNG